MPHNGSPTAGARCGALTRVDLLTFLLAATLCSASYCLGIWHNSRGAADSRVLGPSAAVPAPGAASCGEDADEPLDFEPRHAAENAGLSVSSSAATATTSARRALRGVAPGSTGHRGAPLWLASHGVAWAGSLLAPGGAGERWEDRVAGSRLRFTDAGAVRA